MCIQKINLFFGKNRYNCIVDISKYLYKKNIIYTKIFQSLSANSTVLTNKESKFLKQFTDDVPYCSTDLYNIHTIISELNNYYINDTNKHITLTSDIPINSGLIAVVYSGYINAKPVIIKVIRKNIYSKLVDALKICEEIINILKMFNNIKLYDLETIFIENKQDILNQTNFAKEIENNKHFFNNFKNTHDIIIPYIYDEYSNINKNIIIMDKLTGCDISNLTDIDKNKYFTIFNKFIFKSILYHRIYHADLHLGNIFFNKDNNNNYTIGIIDFGLVGNITKQQQDNLFNILKYITLDKDAEQSCQLIIDNLIEPVENYYVLTCYEKKLMKSKIYNILHDIIINNKHIDLDFIYNTNKLLHTYKLKLSRTFCKVEMAIAVGGSISKTLSSGDDKIYVNKLTVILNEIINPKILDY
jgi:predicted unusual protein kinase regulating ubiquinone biosynthesis (AarF/ABC1/UbiB family)